MLDLGTCAWAEVLVPQPERPVPRSCHSGTVIDGGRHWLICASVGGRVGIGATATAHRLRLLLWLKKRILKFPPGLDLGNLSLGILQTWQVKSFREVG